MTHGSINASLHDRLKLKAGSDEPRRKRAPDAARLARLKGLLVADLKALGFANLGRSDWWWAGKFRYRKACEYVATHLPKEAKRLFKKARISWKTVRALTAEEFTPLGFERPVWFLDAAKRDATPKRHGLLRHLDQ